MRAMVVGATAAPSAIPVLRCHPQQADHVATTRVDLRHDGVVSAIEQAKSAAGDKFVRTADHLQQALPLGLVDEIRVHVIPVLLGGGPPLFGRLGSAITLERTHVLVTLPRRTWDFGVVR